MQPDPMILLHMVMRRSILVERTTCRSFTRFTIRLKVQMVLIYPDVIAGSDAVLHRSKPLDYGITFNSQGGAPINPMARGI